MGSRPKVMRAQLDVSEPAARKVLLAEVWVEEVGVFQVQEISADNLVVPLEDCIRFHRLVCSGIALACGRVWLTAEASEGARHRSPRVVFF